MAQWISVDFWRVHWLDRTREAVIYTIHLVCHYNFLFLFLAVPETSLLFSVSVCVVLCGISANPFYWQQWQAHVLQLDFYLFVCMSCSENKLQQKSQINLQNKKKSHQKKITGFQVTCQSLHNLDFFRWYVKLWSFSFPIIILFFPCTMRNFVVYLHSATSF